MSGVDRLTGQPLSGWRHVVQSINVILTTALGSRVLRRDFGTDIGELVDRPLNDEEVVGWIVAVAEALEPRRVGRSIYGEPRFRLSRVRIGEVGPAGRIEIVIDGTYYPRGHLGDFSLAEPREARLPLQG